MLHGIEIVLILMKIALTKNAVGVSSATFKIGETDADYDALGPMDLIIYSTAFSRGPLLSCKPS